MADRKISDLTALTAPASGDFLPIVDISEAAAATKNKRITIESLFQGIPVNVGIGTSAPNARLEVSAPSASRSYSSSVLDFSNIHLDGATANTTTSALTFGSGGGGGAAVAFSRGSSSDTQISFWTNLAGGANVAIQRMVIDSSGRVGIGTSSPNAALDVVGNIELGSKGASNTTAYLDITTDTTYTDYGFRIVRGGAANGNTQLISRGTGALELNCVDGGYLGFSTSNAERVRIDSSGRVGIGTSSPQVALHVIGTELRVETSAASEGFIRFVNTTGSMSFGMSGAVENQVLLFDRTNNQAAYLYSGGVTGYHAWATNGMERMRIDSNGKALVGTSNARLISSAFLGGGGASAELQVEGTALAMGCFSSNRNDSYGPYLAFVKSRGTTANSFTLVNNGDVIGALSFNGTDGSAALAGAAITAFVDGTPGANDMPGRLVFSTTADGASSPTERMRIDSNGDVAIGTTTSLARLTIEKAFDGGTAIDTNTTTASTTYSAAAFRHNGTVSGSIAVSTTATSYNTSSDYRLKENVTAVTDGITRLQQLKPSRFNFIADSNHTVDGFIAHEVQDVVPEAITGEKDAEDDDGNFVYQGIDQSKLVPLLTAALQEAIGEIESLKARLTAAGI